MKRIFIAHILTESLIRKYKLSTAACNFSFNLMSGGGFYKTFSILGSNVRGELEPEAYEDNRFELIYNNYFRTQKGLCHTIAPIIEQWRVFNKIPINSSVWFYNVTVLNAFLYLLLFFFKRSVQVNVIELDFTPAKKVFSFNRIFIKIINNCHGNIRLAESPLFTNKNSITLPGVVPANAGKEPIINNINNKFLLSGVLQDQISMISMVIKAFSNLPHCELHITGVAGNEALITEYSTRFPNIIWHGNVSYFDYLTIMHSCTFQLSTRDPMAPENQCNFPSKVIEALLHNRVVISTIKYKQIGVLHYFKVDSDLESFTSQIDEISHKPVDSLLSYANQGALVAEMFSTDIWNKSMEIIENNK